MMTKIGPKEDEKNKKMWHKQIFYLYMFLQEINIRKETREHKRMKVKKENCKNICTIKHFYLCYKR